MKPWEKIAQAIISSLYIMWGFPSYIRELIYNLFHPLKFKAVVTIGNSLVVRINREWPTTKDVTFLAKKHGYSLGTFEDLELY